MAKNTFDIAVNYAYKGIHENDTPTKEYLESRYVQCKRQIALAGYRLADYLKKVFVDSEEFTTYADTKTVSSTN